VTNASDPSAMEGGSPRESAQAGPRSAEPEALQFDKADFAGPLAFKTCEACKQVIAAEYFEIGGHVVCPRCRGLLTGDMPDKWRFLRALLFGGVAGIMGTVIWSLIIHFTGYEIGLIAIVVGVGVGKAVRKGSRGRGGWKYQTLAMVLTYLSITTSYVPIVAKDFVQGANNHAAKTAGTSATDSPVGRQGTDAAATSGSPAKSSLTAPVALLAFLALMWGFALIAPFLAGVSNIMGIIIIGIGLYEAWKFNRRVVATGPFRLVAPASPDAVIPGSP